MNGRTWFLGIAVLTALAAGCDNQLSPQARQLLTAGKAAYDSRDDASAVQYMDQFLAANPRSSSADEACYWRGLARYRMKDLPAARADFHRVLSLTHRGDLKAQAFKALGDLAFESDETAVAESMYRQALVLLDEKSPPADEVRYRLGQTLQRMNRWSEADVQFSRLIYRFGDGPLARRAGRIIHCSAWTVQIGAMKARRSAQAMAQEAKTRHDLPASVQAVPGDGGPIFAVQAGRYSTYEQAQAALAPVKAIYDGAFVTPTK